MTINRNFIAGVLFLAGIVVGIVLVDETREDGFSTLSATTYTPEKLNTLCENSAAIQGISSQPSRDFEISDVLVTVIGDRGVLCQVKGKLTNHLSGGRISQVKVERFAFISARSGESELVSGDIFHYLNQSPVVKSLASNKIEDKEPK